LSRKRRLAFIKPRSPGDRPGLRTQRNEHRCDPSLAAHHYVVHRARDDCYATFLKALVTPLLIGSAVSVASFWAAAVSSLVWSVTASNCLRACALVSSTISESDFTPTSSLAKSKAALALARAASMTLRL